MLDTSFVLWLQQWASPALTGIMRAVSLWGYVPSCVAVAIVCGFGGRLRLGVTLILGVDELMDMARTMTNVIGNCLATVAVAKWEGEFKEVSDEALEKAEAAGEI